MSSPFWIDEKAKVNKSYDEFIYDLNSLSYLPFFIYTKSNYDILLNIAAALAAGKNITLLDKDFSAEEIKNFGVETEDLTSKEPVAFNLSDYNDLIDIINGNKESSTITLFTSGTTGRPKKVTHSLNNLTRNVKTGERFENNIWAFAYNLTHFAGLQVLFQALLNKNPIIYVFECTPQEVVNQLKQYSVTNISATPSFYRMILPLINIHEPEVTSVRKVTMGGEKFDSSLAANIQQKFPNAKVTNIYASTEAGSLFNSTGEIFTIDDNKNVRINESGELLIHKNFLGKSESFSLEDEWYNTGDVVEKITDNTFKFVARKKDFINIGGYKINPLEIEDKIKELNFVNDVKVSPRQNSLLGQVLIANIVISNEKDPKEAKKEINNYLKSTLQKWKIPSIYNFTDKLSLTRTGKKVLQ